MKSSLLIAAIASAWAAAALAQEAPSEPDPIASGEPGALRLTIRPSSVQETPAERLARRTQQLDFAFRFICKGCSAAPDPARTGFAPFNPAEVLARGPRSDAR